MDWEINDGASTIPIQLERRGDGWSARIGKRTQPRGTHGRSTPPVGTSPASTASVRGGPNRLCLLGGQAAALPLRAAKPKVLRSQRREPLVIDIIESSPSSVTCVLGNHHVVHADCRWEDDTCHLVIDHVPFTFTVAQKTVASRWPLVTSKNSGRRPTTDDRQHRYEVRAPMPARVVDICVAPGDRVTKGAPVIVLEAMKMQNEIVAPAAGVVRAIHVAAGQTVEGNQILVTFAAG